MTCSHLDSYFIDIFKPFHHFEFNSENRRNQDCWQYELHDFLEDTSQVCWLSYQFMKTVIVMPFYPLFLFLLLKKVFDSEQDNQKGLKYH